MKTFVPCTVAPRVVHLAGCHGTPSSAYNHPSIWQWPTAKPHLTFTQSCKHTASPCTHTPHILNHMKTMHILVQVAHSSLNTNSPRTVSTNNSDVGHSHHTVYMYTLHSSNLKAQVKIPLITHNSPQQAEHCTLMQIQTLPLFKHIGETAANRMQAYRQVDFTGCKEVVSISGAMLLPDWTHSRPVHDDEC